MYKKFDEATVGDYVINLHTKKIWTVVRDFEHYKVLESEKGTIVQVTSEFSQYWALLPETIDFVN